MYVNLAEWLPDQADLGSPGLTEAVNVIPAVRSYRPFPSLSPLSSSALPARPLGAVSAVDTSGNAQTFVGTGTALFQFISLSFTDVSVTGGYSTAATDVWDFTIFQNLLIATNYGNPPQVWTLGTSTQWANLSATAPSARAVATVRDFVVFGNVSDGATLPYRVKWGPIGDPTGVYTPSLTTQADSQDLPTGGHVQRIVGGEVGIILLERAIYRMTYVGGSTIFQFDEVIPNRGTVAPRSVANIGPNVFFLSEDGLFLFDGVNASPIGDEKIDLFLAEDLDSSSYDRVSAAIDPVNKLYMLAYPGANAPGGQPNRILLYNWALGRFALVEMGIELIAQLLTTAYTLEQLDVFGGLEDLPAPLDSRLWAGGAILMSAIDTAYRLGSFTGSALEARLTTGEFEPIEFFRTYLKGLRPLVDGGMVTVDIGTRNLPGSAVSWSGPYAVNSVGKIETRLNARYFRTRLRVAAGGAWSHAQGFQIDDAEDMVSVGMR